jgi:hypothetical protein
MKLNLKALWLVVMAALLLLSLEAQAGVHGRIVLGAQPVAGFQYYAGKRVWDELKVGDALTLIRETDNAYDANAIRIEWHGEKLGYVPRAGNEDLVKLLDKGLKVSGRIINLHAGRSHWQRILFEVLLEE